MNLCVNFVKYLRKERKVRNSAKERKLACLQAGTYRQK
jgi:hypothetical protein